ncbi:MAG: acetyl-CoA carboxylase biotin carboxyl carrier protein [Gammaproteobacteria bacterium]|nr:acetyl-CoA carboxylase biotin carboxyl carrier protein [Gammaproteobacteria bacterium]
MTLTAADVAEIMRVIEQSTFDELTLELDGVKLTLRRAGAAGGFVQNVTTPSDLLNSAATAAARSGEAAAHTGARTAVQAARTAARAGDSAPPDANLSAITSPMLGTFYRAPKPGSAPFVEIGSVVDVDSVIAIIEVMKLMNTVRAGVRGVITEILPADETLVEFGDVLMRARTDT